MNEISMFQNEEFGSVRTIEEDGKALFCGKDCATSLGYSRPNDAISMHCPHTVKHRIGVQTGLKADGSPAIQQVEMAFIPEGDLYRLIIHSKLPAAEKFERWVFDEVLPSIRKNGGYAENIAQLMTMIQNQNRLMERLLERMETAAESAAPCDALGRRRLKPPISIISALDTQLRDIVDEMIISRKYTYVEISRILRENYGIQVCKSSIAKYASQLYMEQII